MKHLFLETNSRRTRHFPLAASISWKQFSINHPVRSPSCPWLHFRANGIHFLNGISHNCTVLISLSLSLYFPNAIRLICTRDHKNWQMTARDWCLISPETSPPHFVIRRNKTFKKELLQRFEPLTCVHAKQWSIFFHQLTPIVANEHVSSLKNLRENWHATFYHATEN